MSAIAVNGLRPQDTAGRWGGEEFLVLLPETAAAAAVELAENLRSRVDAHVFGQDLHCSISIGVAEMRSNDTPDSLVHRADTALYRAKKAGKNRVVFVEDE